MAYQDHIKTWVPILFELRKSIIYDSILAMEWGPESEELVNLSSYEATWWCCSCSCWLVGWLVDWLVGWLVEMGELGWAVVWVSLGLLCKIEQKLATPRNRVGTSRFLNEMMVFNTYMDNT